MRVPQLVILFGEHVIQTADKFFKNYAHRVQIDVLLRQVYLHDALCKTLKKIAHTIYMCKAGLQVSVLNLG